MNAILSRFSLCGTPISCARYGNGHINETYLVVTNRPHLYILQKLNGFVFPNLQGVMDNIVAVTAHIRNKADEDGHTLTLVPTTDGKPYWVSESGEYWRLYEFILNSVCLEKVESIEDFRQSAAAFGEFQNQLSDFPVQSLTEIIPHFHDTPARYSQLRAAIENDAAGRAKGVKAEIQAYLSHEQEASGLMALLQAGKLPLRVTHNDTKLNNVLLRESDHHPLCVIDLDTVMPGLVANDFGDSIRFGASTAAEDEKDLDRVSLSLPLYEAYADAFLNACSERLTAMERKTLPFGAKLMTLECGVRFLADYLNGDRYFHTAYPEHNLVRCRTQLKLAEEMEKNWRRMEAPFA